VLEARAAQPHVELLRLAPFHLVGEEAVEEFARRQRAGGSLADGEVEGLEDAREAKLLEWRRSDESAVRSLLRVTR
jgi:hypothetical protein